MSKLYHANFDTYCLSCGDPILKGDEMHFTTGQKRICVTCKESNSQGVERFDQDGFGEPER